ncbi:putative sphingolipid transporter spinster-like protein 2 isoform X1 [Senna tora]|uniref:Putative sphingolipid transporter spinster-like protein 2 isoform X1 n=1 Tax=Senna tora TaxID=362788 RepID=A0A834WNK4_9FABA|nr:putative sphingolipid transporter spinster-like protein 2 isoform X1 [Senna tora]
MFSLLDLVNEHLSLLHNPFRLIGVGLSVWTFAVAGCGSSFDFWSIAICRMLVGVGEASFISLAAPFIDDNAPVAQKTVWLAMFYMCIPAGTALGYVYGGIVGSYINWRFAFWGEAILMLPFPILGFLIEPLPLKGFAAIESKEVLISVETVVPETEEVSLIDNGTLAGDQASIRESKSTSKLRNQLTRFSNDMRILLQDQVYVINVLGYIAYNFVIGAYSYWGPKAGYNIYHMSNADLLFGGMTIICGIVGTLAGGLVLDRITSTLSNAFKVASFWSNISRSNLLLECFLSKELDWILGPFFYRLEMLSSLAYQLHYIGFVPAYGAPVNYVSLHCVKPSLRPLSMAISTVSIHIFGDVPSSPLVGILQSSAICFHFFLKVTGDNPIYCTGIFLNSVDQFNEDDEEQSATARKGKMEPLLDDSNEA